MLRPHPPALPRPLRRGRSTHAARCHRAAADRSDRRARSQGSSRDLTLSSRHKAALGKGLVALVSCTNGWILDMIAFEGTTPYHLVAYLTIGALTFGFFLPCLFEGIRALAGLAWRQKQAAWPAWAYCGLFYLLAIPILFATFMIIYVLPVPNTFLDPTFRWPADGLSEFGNVVLKFQVVLALHCLAAGITYASR